MITSSGDGGSNAAQHLRQIASILGATGVSLGAFGAHALKEKLASKNGAADNWRTAVTYQLFHSIAILTLSAIQQHHQPTSSSSSSIYRSGQLMGLGTVLFSGSIYLLTLDMGPRKLLGPTTPIGGLLIIAGWIVIGTIR
jgi:uncharacterized membrane protein YgdD (TMEM256/DUF423 family)